MRYLLLVSKEEPLNDMTLGIPADPDMLIAVGCDHLLAIGRQEVRCDNRDVAWRAGDEEIGLDQRSRQAPERGLRTQQQIRIGVQRRVTQERRRVRAGLDGGERIDLGVVYAGVPDKKIAYEQAAYSLEAARQYARKDIPDLVRDDGLVVGLDGEDIDLLDSSPV